MPWKQDAPLSFEAAGRRLEARCYGPPPGEARTVAMLHDGLDCLATWGDFPAQVARATGWGVLAWSRDGFGNSGPADRPGGVGRLEHEALEVLAQVLEHFGFREGVLLGHGEGASLASLYAGSVEDHRIRGLILLAPRFFNDASGREAPAPSESDLHAVHLHPRQVLEHWRRTWDDPAWNIEEVIDYLRIPTLAVQGTADPFSSKAQLDALDTRTYSPVDFAVLEGCGHAPHREEPAETLAAVVDFTTRLRRMEEATVER